MSFESKEPVLHWPDVEAEIERVLPLNQTALLPEIPHLHSETLVFLIRRVRRVDQVVFDCIFIELTHRIQRIAAKAARGFNNDVKTMDILDEVGIEILKLILTETPTRQSEYLEIAFAQAVQRRTLTTSRNYQRSMQGFVGQYPAGPDEFDDDEEIERPIELAPDDKPNQEAMVAAFQNKKERLQMFAIAYSKVKKRRNREAFILHYCLGMPIAAPPGKPSLMRYFRKKESQVKYYLETAMAEAREAL